MAKITKDQISEKDPFGGVRESAKAAKAEVKMLEQGIEMIAQAAKQIKGGIGATSPNSSENLRKINAQQEKANTIAKERERLQKRLNIANSTRIDANAKLKVLISEQNKINKERAKTELGLIGAYEKEQKTLKKLRTEYKNLAVQNKANTKEGRALLKNITQLDIKLRQVDKTVGQTRFGEVTGGINKLRGAIGKLGSALGIVGGFMLLRKVIGDSINIVRDFDKANAELAGVLGKSRDEIAELEQNAKELGATSAFTASQVSELQQAYARLGFTQQEIIQLTQGTINGAIALNAELAETAELTGAVVNTFSEFEAGDAPEILDKMTVATQKSALNFDKLQTSLPIVGGAAEAAGISFDRTLALLGKLSDAGIDASSSANALKNIFIESSAQGLSYEQILKKIVKEQDKLTAANDEFGKRASVSATILAENIEATGKLEESLADAGGTAAEVAEVQLNTLDGSLKLLQSAWEGFILKMNDASGAGNFLTKSLRFVADNLENIVKVIGGAIAVFTTFKIVTLAVSVAQKAVAAAQFIAAAAQKAWTIATNIATAAQWAFNAAMLANPIGLMIAAVAALTAALFALAFAFGDAGEAAAAAAEKEKRETEELIKEKEREIELIQRKREEIDKTAEVATKAIKDEIGLLKAQGAALEDIQEKEKELDKIEENRLKNQIDQIKKQKLAQEEIQKQLKEEATALADFYNETQKIVQESYVDRNFFIQGTIGAATLATGELFDEEDKQRFEEVKDKFIETGDAINDLSQELIQAEAKLSSFTNQQKIAATETERRTLKVIRQEIKDRKELLENVSTRAEAREIQKAIKTREKEIDAIIGSSESIKNLSKSQKELIDEYGEAINKTLKYTNANLELAKSFMESKDAASNMVQTIEKINQELFNQEIVRSQIEANNELIAQLDNVLNHRKANFTEAKRLINQEFDLRVTQAKDAAEAQLLNEDLTAEQRELINVKLKGKLEQLERDRVKTVEGANKQIKDAEAKAQKELLDGAKEADSELDSIEQDLRNKELQAIRESADERIAITEATTDFFVQQADRRIAKIDEEIAAAQRQAGVLAGLAESGNITAQQSLAEQDRIIRESNLRKQRLEQQKQNILLVSSILNAYNNALGAGATPGEAFTEAITNTEVLRRFVSALPTFFDGTEDTGTHGQGVDGRGGFHAVLHPNERVMTAAQNARMGGFSNEDVAEIVEQYRYGNMMPSTTVINKQSGNNEQLRKEMVAVRKAIEDKPVNNIELGEITQAAMVIRQTKIKGNRTTTNRFKVK